MGFMVLELSKLLMACFKYDVIVKRYGSHQRLLFTDTDRLCYHIATDDVYADMLEQSEHYDMSEYPPSHPLFSEVDKKSMGKMKDEFPGKTIAEFVRL